MGTQAVLGVVEAGEGELRLVTIVSTHGRNGDVAAAGDFVDEFDEYMRQGFHEHVQCGLDLPREEAGSRLAAEQGAERRKRRNLGDDRFQVFSDPNPGRNRGNSA